MAGAGELRDCLPWAIATWVGLAGIAAAEHWGLLARVAVLALDPVLAIGAAALAWWVRPGWLLALAVAALVAAIETKVALDFGWHDDRWPARLLAAALIATTVGTIRDITRRP